MKRNKFLYTVLAAATVGLPFQTAHAANVLPQVKPATHASFTSAEQSLINIIDAKRGSSTSVQVGNTSYNWTYAKTNETFMKQILSEARAAGSFIVFPSSGGTLRYNLDGTLQSNSATSSTAYTAAEKVLIDIVNSKRGASTSVQTGNTSYSWTYALENPTFMKQILSQMQQVGTFIVFPASGGSIKYNLNGSVHTDNSTPVSPYTTEEQRLITLIESKKGTNNSVQTGNTSYNWSYAKTVPAQMKIILAAVKANGTFIVFPEAGGYITYNIDGSVRSDNSKKYTAEEEKLIALIESKKGTNNSVQTGSTSYSWSYAKETPAQMKIILAAVKANGTFIVFPAAGGSITYNLDGTVRADNSNQFTAEEQKLITLIESKKGTNNSVQTGNTSYNWSYAKETPKQMKIILAAVKANGTFIVFPAAGGSITYNLDGTVRADNSNQFTAEEQKLITLIESKKGTSNSVQVGNTSYSWSYAKETPTQMKKILAEVKAKGSFITFISNGFVTTTLDGKSTTTYDKTTTPPSGSTSTDFDDKISELEKLTEELKNLTNSTNGANAQKFKDIESELKALLEKQQLSDQKDTSLDDKIKQLQAEMEKLKNQTNQNTSDIEQNKQDIKENRSMIDKLADAMDNLIKTLGTFINVLKGILNV